jgi:hypothetical protein
MRSQIIKFLLSGCLVALLASQSSGSALAQPNASGSSSQTPGLVPQTINPDEPTYCRAEDLNYCNKEQGADRRACLVRNVGKVGKSCRTALTLTPTTGGPGGFGRPIDAQ